MHLHKGLVRNNDLNNIEHIQQQWEAYDPSMNTEPLAMIGHLLRCTKHVNDQMKAVFAQYDLNRPSFDMLATLLRSGAPYALTPNELVEQMLVTSGTMTNRIDKLESKGLVKRVRGKRDKRSVFVKLSKSGKKLIESMLAEHIKTQEHIVRGLSQNERTALSALLLKLYKDT